MSALNETPSANRTHIAFFGVRNAGKSTLVNAFTGQSLAIVSDVAGTTTDPVSKAMEILPLGPCLVTDTAGLDDVGALGAQRVERTLGVLATTDVAVWVWTAAPTDGERTWYERFRTACRERRTAVLEFRRGDDVAALRAQVAAVRTAEAEVGLLEGLAGSGEGLAADVVCVCPIDAAAPKGRLILPQVQVVRDSLDRHVTCSVCQPSELASVLERRAALPAAKRPRTLVVTDSQAFGEVRRTLDGFSDPTVSLTSFSVLFARQKGDLAAYREGVAAIARLKDGDRVLVAEGCTHHRQCNDIGTTQIPKALEKLSGKRLEFEFSSGGDFDLGAPAGGRYALVVHCGGCMLTRREVLRRIGLARDAGVPIANYGLVLSAAQGGGV